VLAKEIERTGLPTAHICVITRVAEMVGSNRIIPARSIVAPLGDLNQDAKGEKALRRAIVERALEALQEEIQDQKVFM